MKIQKMPAEQSNNVLTRPVAEADFEDTLMEVGINGAMMCNAK